MHRKLMLGTAMLALVSALGLSAAKADDRPAALIISQSGLGDQSYNDLAYEGFKRGLEATKLEGRPIESKEVVAQAVDILRRASDANFGLVVDLEYAHGDALTEVAKDYPDTKYVILNQVREGANVASVLFQEQEGSYLAGTLAALVTTDTSIKGINAEPVIGVIGGTKSAGIDKFIAGYMEGAKAANPDVKVLVAYSNNFADPAIGLQMTKAMFEQGADIVYQIAGGTGMGVIQAAKEAGHYAIGVDTDQDGLAPGSVLTSMIKRTDVAVEAMLKDYAADTFPAGKTAAFGLKEGGVGLSEMKHTKELIPAPILEKVETAKQDILSGKVQVWNVVTQGYPDWLK
ncbi:BMP family protein [Mesorhizobium sp. J428]|uniref:BMP family lipoprotein n=1 Tax=Mesorhizobium sp. J428 TaxID=2898440 RepID=UPI002151E158|nr:BMP family ABC transporter substrate-binding protein [Mesorhizobium sp. J428]MCR5856725.1 BMP family ABC transporter substrate-binding protein [Mesorhizobium sp. J428]